MLTETKTRDHWKKVGVWFAGDIGHTANVITYSSSAPDIHKYFAYAKKPKLTIDLTLDCKPCTDESKGAFLEALRDWLQARYDAGDRTYDGLSAFVEQARIEYLQPMEEA